MDAVVSSWWWVMVDESANVEIMGEQKEKKIFLLFAERKNESVAYLYCLYYVRTK
jgi:hypothetical protein